MISTAAQIASIAHGGQFRRDEVTPYIVHPQKVASYFDRFTFRWQAAWLHDVLEDTGLHVEDLRRQGIDEEVIEAVQVLTREKSENYDAFIDRIISSRNQIAIDVKIADLLANLSDSPKRFQMIRYGKSLTKLAPLSRFWG